MLTTSPAQARGNVSVPKHRKSDTRTHVSRQPTPCRAAPRPPSRSPKPQAFRRGGRPSTRQADTARRGAAVGGVETQPGVATAAYVLSGQNSQRLNWLGETELIKKRRRGTRCTVDSTGVNGFVLCGGGGGGGGCLAVWWVCSCRLCLQLCGVPCLAWLCTLASVPEPQAWGYRHAMGRHAAAHHVVPLQSDRFYKHSTVLLLLLVSDAQ